MSNQKIKTKIITISVPSDVLEIMRRGAKDENRSLSNYIANKFRKKD